MTLVEVTSDDDLWVGEMRTCLAGAHRLVVLKGDGYIAAYEDRCAHLGVRLSEGAFDGRVLTCRAHLWRYDARTGRGINPTAARLRCFPTRVLEGAVWVDVSEEV